MTTPAPSTNRETKLEEKPLKALIEDFAAAFVSLWHGRPAPEEEEQAALAHTGNATAPHNGDRPQGQDRP